MNLKEAIFLLVFTILIVAGFFYLMAILSNEESEHQKKLCSWEPGSCKKLCTIGKFYFDKENGFCRLWEGINCCTEPIFNTLRECQSACE